MRETEKQGMPLTLKTVTPTAASLFLPVGGAKRPLLKPEEEGFVDLFERLCLSLLGQKITLIGRKHAKKYKLEKLRAALAKLKDQNIDQELFLRAQFFFARENPKYLFFNAICSDNAIERYKAWISEYANEKDARKSNRELSLDEILDRDLKLFLALRRTLTPSQIFQTYIKSFSPFFLFFSPEFKTWRVGKEKFIPPAVSVALTGLEEKLSSKPFKEVYEFVKHGEAICARRNTEI